MRRHRPLQRALAGLLAACCPLVAAAAVAADPPVDTGTGTLPVDELVRRNTVARGGADALHAMHSVRLTGRLVVDDGQFQMAFVQTVALPARVRNEVTLQGLIQVEAWDGQEGWHVDPFGGRKDPERLTGDDAKELVETAADMPGPLVDWAAKGARVEALGREDVEGTLAYKLRLVRAGGDVEIVWLDPDHFLEIRLLSQRRVHGTLVETQSDLGDYEQVGGVWMPMSIESGRKGSRDRQKVVWKTAEVNVAVEDAVFRFPTAPVGATAARPPSPGPSSPASAIANTPAAAPAASTPAAPAPFTSGLISGLGARNIGSAVMSGRIAALAGFKEPSGRTTLYVGAASGGVWKSEDAGTRFRPVFDDQPTQSIGAIALDPSAPRTVWVGTGESWTRNSVSIGDGLYRSTDGGDTWQHRGLPRSERIAAIVVHPKDGRVVYACVTGALWSDSQDRGLYRTTDGGDTWTLVLRGPNASTGCASVAMDPAEPQVLFASLWDFRRTGWSFRSGGETPAAPSGSGLFRSADGGASWQEVTPEHQAGFPKKPYGRIAVAVAPSNPKRVYAFVESTDSALYASDDGGATWAARDRSQWMVWRPFYFARLVVDPLDPDRLFKTDGALIESTDAGRSFSAVGGFVGMHGDVHDVWIDPTNPQVVIAGDDGGLYSSHDGGHHWWKSNNLPISQFYHVTTDDTRSYHVFGGLQDNGTWRGASRFPGGIASAQWESIYGGDGFWAWPDPVDPDYAYAESQGGELGHVRLSTHEVRSIQPLLGPAEARLTAKLRFNWNTPVMTSPGNPRTLYIGSQFLWRSRDQGRTWQRLSPDLTTNDPAHQKQEQSGGVTVDNSAAEMFETIYTISESPRDARVLWAGTDDGRLQVSRDDGAHWQDVAPRVPGLPAGSWVSWVQAGLQAPGTAYAAFDRHTFGDMAPYVYRTVDYGRTWTPLVTAADAKGVRGYAHVVRQDPKRPSLLYLGTEFGLWISVDDGAHWARFAGGDLPPVAVRDLAFPTQRDDLVIATHGRGIWVVDDRSPLRSLTPGLMSQDIALVPGGPAEQRLRAEGGGAPGAAEFIGDNPRGGAVITYFQRERHLFGRLTLEVLDARGHRVASLPASKRPGLNRVVWNLQERAPRVPPAAQLAEAGTLGPRVLPGTYTVRITKNGHRVQMPLQVVLDREATFTLADRRAQHAAASRVRELFGQESALMKRIVALRAAVSERLQATPAGDPLHDRLAAFDARADALRRQVVATTEGGAITGEERLREHTDHLYGALIFHEGRPSPYQLGNLRVLEGEQARIAHAFDALLESDLAALNRGIVAAGGAALPAPPDEDEDKDDEDDDDDDAGSGAGGAGDRDGGIDADALMTTKALPAGFRPMH